MTIKPCPFCGSTKPLVFREGETFRWRVAECFQCGAKVGEERIQTMGSGTREEWETNCKARLIEAWNTRADDKLRAAAIAARKALSELLMSRDPVVYSDALRMLDEALGDETTEER